MTQRMTLPEARPELMKSWNHDLNQGLDPDTLSVSSTDLAWWNCDRHGPFLARVKRRAHKSAPTGCQKCAIEAMRQSKIIPAPGNSLAEVAPLVAASWHVQLNGTLKPTDLAAGSSHKAWWNCQNHGPWQATVASRAVRGHGCKKCGAEATAVTRSTPAPGRSLADRRPDMAAQWHPTLNGALTPKDVMPGSRKVVWWNCPEHGAWEQSLNVRYSQGCGCPPCGTAKAKLAALNTAARRKAAVSAQRRGSPRHQGAAPRVEPMGKAARRRDGDTPRELEGQMTIDDILVPLGEPPTAVPEVSADDR